ncbi:mannose-1-phosphate guanylyltransferase [Hathewaya proteolytica DSM 3090]|uniref:mannose-1-phosphate guanylyltransferase n=1 Tax=Hathewaya proteolytica DSM 3090 TaxID=1121331 RepID=A0A1M6RMA0_9CLOT|nr:mannose-1-phosphate guanylyltransferase [Hathewaya proteolytica]SHK33574.1 mannose-1-phosphate guanylyltransferase [Hathewaya proteolytica DSM 3090]
MLYALILAGGKGTRLYPLSRNENPKQFLNVINDKTFLENTIERISPIVPRENIFIVTNELYYDKICGILPYINKSNIFIEPYNKETATCIGFSAIKLLKRDNDATMIVLPSDHHIENVKEFQDCVNQAVSIATKRRGIVTMGVNPDRPETGYGYIQMGDRVDSNIPTYRVERFLEKPNVEVAKDLLCKGDYLWNSGMFVWRADVFLREMEKYLPKMYKRLMMIYESIDSDKESEVTKEQYELIEGISVDFGIMQKTRKAYVVKCSFPWDDIGSYAALGRFMKQFRGNNIKGKVYMEDSEDCSVFADKRLVIGFGVSKLVIVDTGDVILVMNKDKDQEIKHLVTKLKEESDFEEFL